MRFTGKMKKKGYFYTFDAVLAVIILVIGIILIASFYMYAPEKSMAQDISADMAGLLSDVRVDELCGAVPGTCSCPYPVLEDVCNEYTPADKDMSILQLFGLLYFKNNRTAIDSIVDEMIIQEGILPDEYELQLMLEDPKDPGKLEQLYPLVSKYED